MAQEPGTFDSKHAGPPRTHGWWPLAIGLVCMLLLAPTAFGVGVWLGVHRGTQAFQGGSWTASSPKQLDASTTYVIYAASGVSTQVAGRCGAVDPAGAFIQFNSSSGNVTVNDQSERGTFTTTTAGSYRLNCGDVSLRVISNKQVEGLGKDIGIPIAVGVGGAALLGLVGLVLTIVGIVRLVGSNNRRKQWQMSQHPQWAPGPPQGPGQQWGPGPQ